MKHEKPTIIQCHPYEEEDRKTQTENLPGCSVRLELVAKPCYESPGRTFLWERVGREGKGFGFEKDDLTKWMILGRWWYKRGKASSLIGFEDFFLKVF